ncbi:MAG: hypothetical protein ABI140_21975 [Jatrophihabitantaceae bacterium]
MPVVALILAGAGCGSDNGDSKVVMSYRIQRDACIAGGTAAGACALRAYEDCVADPHWTDISVAEAKCEVLGPPAPTPS